MLEVDDSSSSNGCLWLWWIVGFVGLMAIVFRQFEYDVWKVHHERCKTLHATNAALLASAMCDKSVNELAFRDKVNCESAREENAWGIGVCTVTSRFSKNTLADALLYARESWYVFIFILVVAALIIRAHFNARAEVAKHRVSMKAVGQLLPAVQRMHEEREQKKREPPRRSRSIPHLPSLQGYRRDQFGNLAYKDNRPELFNLT